MALGAHRMQPSSRPLRAGTRTRSLTGPLPPHITPCWHIGDA